MTYSDNYIFKWDDFQENIRVNFRKLRSETDFCDVTLACEDGQQVEAHKVILAGQVLLDKLFYSHHHINVNNFNNINTNNNINNSNNINNINIMC